MGKCVNDEVYVEVRVCMARYCYIWDFEEVVSCSDLRISDKTPRKTIQGGWVRCKHENKRVTRRRSRFCMLDRCEI